ncbi:flagellar motor switch protein FliN [Halomonas daqiaonensis]|uniref:Flagellar motor switch protein FliN n=1 Tax=Halomonas daqiaonensis TaxID=650850 RepID=A0A1H7SNG7_9GAMM|nr:flagellar motor switch protein FliN [Halomonas daqiaonensis]SEL74180.1 flagellar motor switch protein FliN/FliY [Halomonas daqiaonensis]
MTDPNKPDPKKSDPNKPDPDKPVSDKSDKSISEDDWTAAMSEQQDDADTPADDDDPWAEAMAEQSAAESSEQEQKAEQAEARPAAQSAGGSVFRPLEAGQGSTTGRDLEMIMDIPVKLTVELGRTKLTIKQLLELAQGSVVELDGLAGEPMDILINGYLIAQGEVVVVEDKYGIRITEIITPSERVQKLNR